LAHAAGHRLRAEVQLHPERLEDVGAAALGGGRAVAVLDHRHARGGHHDRGHGGDVHRAGPVAAGADDVHRVTVDAHQPRVLEHAAGQAVEFGGGGHLDLHGDAEGGDLGAGGVVGHDLVHHPCGVGGAQVAPVG